MCRQFAILGCLLQFAIANAQQTSAGCPDGFPDTWEICDRSMDDQDSGCPPKFFCFERRICCRRPVCPDGQPAKRLCHNQACSDGYVCISGGCCSNDLEVKGQPERFEPMVSSDSQQQCPDRKPSVGRCTVPGTCLENQYCYNNVCCHVPICPDGDHASLPCRSTDDCPSQSICINDGCCSAVASTSLTSDLTTTSPITTVATVGPDADLHMCMVDSPPVLCVSEACPAGHRCSFGICCRTPLCPNNQPSVASCKTDQQCPVGHRCSDVGCCPTLGCPGNHTDMGWCPPDGVCPSNHYCFESRCCRVPLCEHSETPPVQSCDLTMDTCPFGHQCTSTGCCPRPLPECPGHSKAGSYCDSQRDCPDGFFCFEDRTDRRGCCKDF